MKAYNMYDICMQIYTFIRIYIYLMVSHDLNTLNQCRYPIIHSFRSFKAVTIEIP